MVLPMNLWLALEEDVARHKAEIAEQFAKARERLLSNTQEQNPSQSIDCTPQWLRGQLQNAGILNGIRIGGDCGFTVTGCRSNYWWP